MESVLFVDGRKFMWDGRGYESRECALVAAKAYESDGFETHLSDEQEGFRVYTRRLVTPPPAEPPPGS